MKAKLRGLIMLFMAFAAQFTFAQEKTISGTVADESGLPLAGVNILVKGTTNGTQTDFDGNYTITANVGETLVFSYVGMETQEIVIGDTNTINVTLKEDAEALDEIVVTAVGIKRKPDEITTAYEKVDGEKINAANNPSAVQALSGKVSGLTINTTGGGVNPNTEILLRGTRAITGDQSALIVIDNVISSATVFSNLDPNIIDNVTVLKGPNGAALYGSRGGNGVIVVTTKKGSKKGGSLEVQLKSSVTFEEIDYLPELQDRYGKGYWGEIDAFDQGSWGPEYDGSLQPVGLPYPTFNDFRENIYEFREDNMKPFFDTGVTFQNTLSLTGGDQDGYYTISANKQDIEGVVPNDKRVKDFLTLNAGKTFGKLKIGGIARFTNTRNDVASFYDVNSNGIDDTTLYGQLAQLPSDVDISQFSSGSNSDHWTAFGDSPYWILNNSRLISERRETDLTLDVSYQINDNISAIFRGNVRNINRDYTDFLNDYTSEYTITGDARNIISNLELQSDNSRSHYLDLITTFDYQLTEDIGLKALAGFNNTYTKTYFLNTFGSQLTIPGQYTASNISSGLQISDGRSFTKTYALFANVDLSYKDYLYLNLTARNDWDSRLQTPGREVGDIAFFYPSASVAFHPTKAFPELKGDVLEKAKVSLGYVRVGSIPVNPHDLYDVGTQAAGFPYSTTGINSFVSSINTADAGVEPQFISTWEANLNLEFLKINGTSRITLDATASFYDITNQVLNTSVSSSTGAQNAIVNVGETTTDAFEIDLGFTPIKTDSFRWSGNIGFFSSRTTVEKVTDQSSQIATTIGGPPDLYAIEGQEFPVIQGTAYERDDQGRVILNEDGSPRVASGLKVLGRTTPDYILNFGTQVSYKGFRLSATADYRTGHVFYSGIYNNLTGQGRSFVTAENGRGHFIFPNSTVAGIGTANTSVLTGPSYGGPTPYAQYQSFVQSNDFTGVDENFIVDATAFKLREVSLDYTLPNKYLENTFIKGLSVGVSGRNLLTVLPKENRGYNDPEFGNGIGGYGVTPPTKFYAMNVNLTF